VVCADFSRPGGGSRTSHRERAMRNPSRQLNEEIRSKGHAKWRAARRRQASLPRSNRTSGAKSLCLARNCCRSVPVISAKMRSMLRNYALAAGRSRSALARTMAFQADCTDYSRSPGRHGQSVRYCCGFCLCGARGHDLLHHRDEPLLLSLAETFQRLVMRCTRRGLDLP
jgi:hypothetical protein